MINIYTERAAGKIGAADENKYKKIRGREMLSGLVINPKTLQGSANNGLSNIQNSKYAHRCRTHAICNRRDEILLQGFLTASSERSFPIQ
jgi:hypothetical protein